MRQVAGPPTLCSELLPSRVPERPKPAVNERRLQNVIEPVTPVRCIAPAMGIGGPGVRLAQRKRMRRTKRYPLGLASRLSPLVAGGGYSSLPAWITGIVASQRRTPGHR
jgi:hypothetical protein